MLFILNLTRKTPAKTALSTQGNFDFHALFDIYTNKGVPCYLKLVNGT